MHMDHLDKLAASAFDGFLVRKDLVRQYSRQYPVPNLCRGVPARPVLRHGR